MDEASASSSSVWKHFEKNNGRVRDVQTLPEDVEVEREYDKQSQRASAFARKPVP